MPIATISNLEKTFGKRVLFDKLNFTIDRGERVGLIGANGSGKSTLFKMLVDEMTPDAGSVAIAKNIKLGHLTQDPKFEAGNTVMDEAELAFADLHRLAHQLRDLEHAMGEKQGDELDKILEKYQDVQHEFDLAGGYVWHHKLEDALLGVGLERGTWEQLVTTLSGGQRSRLALAKLLISVPDILLLDEPTNHLDLAAIEWLENYLLEFTGACIIISHDRYFLDKLATRIVWLTQCKLNSYPGNYSAFVVQKELHELTQQRQYERQQEDIDKQKEFIRRFGAGQRSKEAKGREKRLDRLLKSDAMIQSVQNQSQIHMSLSTDQRAGDQVLNVRELSKKYDANQLWKDIGFHVKRGERIGIIGPNGSGKTTMLEVLLGKREADAGILKWGANLSIGYYNQKLDDFDPDLTVFDEVRGSIEGVSDQAIRNMLGALLFKGDDMEKRIELLSGGERARVRLSELLLEAPNVLILDEPTNHLDIASCEALEAMLKTYNGTILCVSHDRYFLDHATSRLFILDPPGLIDFDGNYSAWVARQREKAKEAAAVEAAAKRDANRPKKQEKKGPAPSSSKWQQHQKHAPQHAKPPAGNKQAKDNPYARPFGRLTQPEIEAKITETEIALANAQNGFADTHAMRDGNKKRTLEAEVAQLSKTLKELEAEYYLREQ